MSFESTMYTQPAPVPSTTRQPGGESTPSHMPTPPPSQDAWAVDNAFPDDDMVTNKNKVFKLGKNVKKASKKVAKKISRMASSGSAPKGRHNLPGDQQLTPEQLEALNQQNLILAVKKSEEEYLQQAVQQSENGETVSEEEALQMAMALSLKESESKPDNAGEENLLDFDFVNPAPTAPAPTATSAFAPAPVGAGGFAPPPAASSFAQPQSTTTAPPAAMNPPPSFVPAASGAAQAPAATMSTVPAMQTSPQPTQASATASAPAPSQREQFNQGKWIKTLGDLYQHKVITAEMFASLRTETASYKQSSFISVADLVSQGLVTCAEAKEMLGIQ